jgi:hypothetical protein
MKLINADQLTPEQRRERNRLRSERWRRAHGIPPRKPAARPWLAQHLVPETGEGPPAGRAGARSGHTRDRVQPVGVDSGALSKTVTIRTAAPLIQ